VIFQVGPIHSPLGDIKILLEIRRKIFPPTMNTSSPAESAVHNAADAQDHGGEATVVTSGILGKAGFSARPGATPLTRAMGGAVARATLMVEAWSGMCSSSGIVTLQLEVISAITHAAHE
jgi:hypothetical protein